LRYDLPVMIPNKRRIQGNGDMRLFISLSLILLVVAATGCSTPFPTVPRSGNGWSLSDGPERVTAGGIRERKGGEADEYLKRGFQQLRIWRYSAGGKAVVVEVYAMGTPDNARDTLSSDMSGEEVDIGIPALYSSGVLEFARGSYFARVAPETGTQVDRKIILDIGRALAVGVPGSSIQRGLLSLLPKEGLVPGTAQCSKGTIIADTELPNEVALLSLTGATENAVADYKTNHGQHTLILVRYPDASAMQRAWKRFQEHYLPASIEAPASLTINADGKAWLGAAARDNVMYVVIGASDREACDAVLDTIEQ